MMWDIARKHLADLPNVYYDTSSTYGFGGIEPVKEGFRAFDNSHLFFGCDYPMWDYRQELDMLETIGLTQRELEDVLFNNFARFYGLPLNDGVK